MGFSINVKQPGTKQIYNLRDPEQLHRAQKAINGRITQIAKTFGTDSQIYKDYVAPLTNDESAPITRLDLNKGIIKLKTGKITDYETTRDVVENMLSKATKSDIIERTRLQIDPNLNIKKKSDRERIIQRADEIHKQEMDVYSRLNELYKLESEEYKTTDHAGLSKYDWYNKLKKSHGKPSGDLVNEIMESLRQTDDNEIILPPEI